MNALRIPDNGVLLKGPPGKSAGLPSQAFTLSLNDNVIQDMIKCHQNGGDLRLALGKTPTFHYGSKTHRVSKPLETSPRDLYLTQPYETIREASRIPHAGSLFEKPKAGAGAARDAPKKAQKDTTSQSKLAQGGNASPSSLDSDIEALQGQLAVGAGKERSVIVSGLPASRKGAAKAKGKLFGGNAASPRSMPASPALKPTTAASPNPALSTSEQLMERLKLQRRNLVHELAVGEQTLAHLEAAWDGKPEDFRTALEKVGSEDLGIGKWVMKKAAWRELDVFQYDYGSDDRREKAIENAIKQYDKARLSASEPEWQRLLPMEERNKGKCLSRLQGRLANGPTQAPPKIKVQRADDSSTSTSKDDGDLAQSDRGKVGGESMSRSSSNPLPKAKKPTAQQAQTKRLLGTNTKAKPSTPKVSPTKKAAGTKANGGRILSQEIIVNSDSSGDEDSAPAPAAKPVSPVKQAPRPVERPAEKPAAKPAAKPAPKPKPAKPVVREPVRQVSNKRPYEEEDTSSSSSGSPLSKRLKPKHPLVTAPPKKRPAEARHLPREQTSSYAPKNKNTSPIKSSPLASSPPTNASDLSEEERPVVVKKRKAVEVNEPPPKRQAISADVMNKAQKFKQMYQKYEALYKEIVKVDNPPDEKLDRLQQMRDRLSGWKKDIYRQCSPVGH